MLCTKESSSKFKYVFRYYKNGEVFKVYETSFLSDVIEAYSAVEKRIVAGEYDFVILTVYSLDGTVMTRLYLALTFDFEEEFEKLM